MSHDPIRGESTYQVPYLPDSNDHNRGGDYFGPPNRNSSRRADTPRPRSTDDTVVESRPGTWRTSRLMQGQDWLVGVPVVEQPPVSGFPVCLVWTWEEF